METTVRRLMAVTLVLLVAVVKGVDCWSSTHTYYTGGGIGFIALLCLFCRCLMCWRRAEQQSPPARRLEVVTSTTIPNVAGSSSPGNPYNTGYDQPNRPSIPSNPAANAQPGNPTTPCQPPPYDQIKEPNNPYDAGYDQRF